MNGKNTIAILALNRLPTISSYEVRTEIVILGRLPHSDTLYMHVRKRLDLHFDLNPTAKNFLIGSPYRNSDFRPFPTLTYAV